MSAVTRFLSHAFLPAILAGCASTPPAPVVATAPPAPIAVSCQTDALSDQPCIAAARQACPDAAVDTIRLVLAKPAEATAEPYGRQLYDYQATYTCPSRKSTSGV